MDTQQTATGNAPAPPTDAERVAQLKHLNYLQDNYITFCASSGISQDEDGEFTVMTVKQFAAAAGVNRTTLWRWQKSIPDFWRRVDQRAREIFNQSTKYAIFKGLKLKALTGDVKAAEMVLSHYSDYTPPAQKHEVKLTGWGDMVREARKAKIKARRPAAEAEVIDQAPAPYAAAPAQALPPAPTPQPAPPVQMTAPTYPQPQQSTPPVIPSVVPTPQGGPVNSSQPVIV